MLIPSYAVITEELNIIEALVAIPDAFFIPESELESILETGAWYEGRDKAVQTVTGSLEPMARTFKYGGRRYLDVLAPVTGLGGSRPIAIRYLYTYRSLEDKTGNLIQRAMMAALGLIILVAVLSVYLSRALTRPISLLSASARRIAEARDNWERTRWVRAALDRVPAGV